MFDNSNAVIIAVAFLWFICGIINYVVLNSVKAFYDEYSVPVLVAIGPLVTFFLVVIGILCLSYKVIKAIGNRILAAMR